ncbi:MAG: type 4a pilus biogenesis protein PilO [Limnohabitans sp.]|jgi:type IV pilus assembly protein PilO|nr:type 4a pilus biogenesis protein PilO [Limnohabitans sp.]
MSQQRGVRDLAFFAVLVAIPIASYFFVFAPRNNEIAKARSEISAKRTRLADLSRLTARIGDLGREIATREEELEKLNQKLPDREGVDRILEQVTQIAQKSNLAVRSVTGGKAVPAGLAMELPLKTVIEGNFEGFYQFLLDVESLPRITRMHAMKISKLGMGPRDDPKDAMGDAMRAEFTLSIYFNGTEPEPSSRTTR